MRYEQFDHLAFDSVASYFAPKVLGCLGIAIVGLVVFILLALLIETFDLPKSILIFSIMAFFAAGTYASTLFDEWHNKRQMYKRRHKHGR